MFQILFVKSTPVYTVISESDEYEVRYWIYLLREMSGTRFIESLSKSIRQRTTEFRWLMWRDLYFPIPPPSEQEQLVSFLDYKTQKIDELIENTEQKIELLKEKRISLINHCVTKGLNPNVEMKDSGVEWIGEIPSGWDKTTLKYISEIITGNTPPKNDEENYEGGENLWVKPDELNGFYPTNQTKEKLTEKGKSFSRVIPPYSVFVNGIGNIGRFGFSEMKVSTNQQINSVVFNEKCSSRFGLYLISIMEDEFQKQSEKVVVSILSKSRQQNVKTVIPPLSEQTQIVDYLNEHTQNIDPTIEKETQRIELLKEYRQSLISEVVTGKFDVRDWTNDTKKLS